MLKSSEIKKTAVEKLKGNWTKAFGIATVFTIVNIALSLVYTFAQNATANTPILYYGVAIIYIALFLPLSFGLISSMTKLVSGEKVSFTGFLNDAILNWSKCISIFIRTIIGILIPAIIIILATLAVLFLLAQFIPISTSNVSGYALFIVILFVVTSIGVAICAIPYVLSTYALANDNSISGKEAVAKSRHLMKKNKWKFIKLMVSFALWILLLSFISALVEMYTVSLAASFVQWIGMIFLLPYLITSLLVFYEELNAVSEVVVEDATPEQPENEE